MTLLMISKNDVLLHTAFMVVLTMLINGTSIKWILDFLGKSALSFTKAQSINY